MHRDKTAARILLILSVVHVVVAAPAIVRQRSLDVDEDATPAWEKRGNPGNTPQDLYPVPQMDNERPPASGAPQLDNDPQPPSGAPHLHNDPPPALGTPQLHDDPLAASGTSSVHDDLPLGSGEFDESYRFKDLPYSPSLHEGAPPLHEEAPSWASYETVARPTNNFMSDAAKKELITLGKYGATAAVTFGLIYGASKLFNSRAYVSAFFPPSPADI